MDWAETKSTWYVSHLRANLYQSGRGISMISSVEWSLAGKTEVLGENLSQCQFVHISDMTWPVIEPNLPRWRVYDTANYFTSSRNNIYLH
jgi:hypothetical protein